eukprot:2569199-Pleurochrysis_carterae.AAC.1
MDWTVDGRLRVDDADERAAGAAGWEDEVAVEAGGSLSVSVKHSIGTVKVPLWLARQTKELTLRVFCSFVLCGLELRFRHLFGLISCVVSCIVLVPRAPAPRVLCQFDQGGHQVHHDHGGQVQAHAHADQEDRPR